MAQLPFFQFHSSWWCLQNTPCHPHSRLGARSDNSPDDNHPPQLHINNLSLTSQKKGQGFFPIANAMLTFLVPRIAAAAGAGHWCQTSHSTVLLHHHVGHSLTVTLLLIIIISASVIIAPVVIVSLIAIPIITAISLLPSTIEAPNSTRCPSSRTSAWRDDEEVEDRVNTNELLPLSRWCTVLQQLWQSTPLTVVQLSRASFSTHLRNQNCISTGCKGMCFLCVGGQVGDDGRFKQTTRIGK